jgi:uncharacterized protein
MKTSILFLIILIQAGFGFSNPTPNNSNTSENVIQQFDLEGTWQGKLKINTIELRIVFNVSRDTTGKLTATLDSPDQNANGIAVDEVVVKDDSVKFIVNAVAGFYDGVIIEDIVKIVGHWHQGGMNLNLDLIKNDVVEKINRPQEPKEPFPYKSEEVKIINYDVGDTLAGTLTLPESGGPFTAVILVTGSGPQNRNEELLGHKPFLVLSDYLTRNGIAVLRYDDRGAGESTGDFKSATSIDFADDALAAVEFLKKRKDINKIGIAGHSEGGLIAPLAAMQSDAVDFIVMIAGPGVRGDSILMLQSELILRANGSDEESIKKEMELNRSVFNVLLSDSSNEVVEKNLKAELNEGYNYLSDEEKKQAGDKGTFFANQMKVMMSPWFRFFVKYNPYPVLEKVKCPVLAINGEKDMQVPPKENLSAIESALKEGGNKNYKIVEMPGLNHLFQTSKTGSPMEYSKIEETFSPDAMKVIKDWILSLTK